MAAAAVYAKNKLTDDGIANKKSTGMRFQDYGPLNIGYQHGTGNRWNPRHEIKDKSSSPCPLKS